MIHPQSTRPLFRRDDSQTPRTYHEVPETLSIGDGITAEVFSKGRAIALHRDRDSNNVDFPARFSSAEWSVELSRDHCDVEALRKLRDAIDVMLREPKSAK